ncbi:MAG TPA: P1 family peptidase [Thermomicrobiaceae bacterium]|nr:P1 family peptidase [Thermomicrobiaceae bacterium]
MSADPGFSIPGFRVGHWTHPSGATGCSVVLCDQPALAVADVRGGAPGTRELAVLGEGRLVQRLDAVLLTGGSAFGLDAAGGVMRWLREQGRGFATRSIPVPIVAGAVIFDLAGASPPWPDAEAGYAAAAGGQTDGWRSGRIGAGSGATWGKLGGQPVRGGVGAARVSVPGGELAALIVVNALGEVVDPDIGRPLRAASSGSTSQTLPTPGENTTIGVLATTVPLDRAALVRLAIAAHDGLARAIRPAHTVFDGDTIFALTTQEARPTPEEVLVLGMAAADAVARAVVRAATS